MIYTDEERASKVLAAVLRPIDWAILFGWIGALALVLTCWFWALKGFFLVILG